LEFNAIGLAAGMATFLGVWVGHVLVRKLEYQSTSIFLPSACFALIGLSFEIGSFLFNSSLISTILGILGMTALWDSFEFFRQQKRVIKGHAPANPSNPRHARILEQFPSATTLDLLKRDPIGRAVDADEAVRLIVKKENTQ
jgi:hypothetical protein